MTSPLPQRPWHALPPQDVLRDLNVDRDAGLSTAEVEARRAQYGTNEIQTKAGRSKLSILVDQFTNIMLLMLIAVAVVSGAIAIASKQFPKDAIAIFAIVILNGILGYVQESRAEDALAALKKLSAPIVRVLRAGQIQEIPSQLLVPGDIAFIEAGMQVAADGRLLETANLRARQSALTGEANPVHKNADAEIAEDEALGDRSTMVYQGTEIVQGRGTMVVTGTGMGTELGRVATLLQNVESEPTPLQQRMSQLGNVLVTGSLILVGVVVALGLWRGGQFVDLLETSLSMAVAVVPEGLPAVITVTLALGTQRMVRRQALIRKLPAVETLGSVTTICSDKTGTLTQNKMVVESVYTSELAVRISGKGYEPKGEMFLYPSAGDPRQLDAPPQHFPELHGLLLNCAVCNDAHLQQNERGEWMVIGDPTEGALLTLAGKAGLEQAELATLLPRKFEIPFTSERKRMSVVCAVTDNARSLLPLPPEATHLVFTKGSAELVLGCCDRVWAGNRIEPLTAARRQAALDWNDKLAADGIRVLGFALDERRDFAGSESTEAIETGLIWLGLVGMRDAPRAEVAAAVETCRAAGIRPVMITGDHQLTARAIARDLGIASGDARVVTGQELERMTNAELDVTVPEIGVYARVAPEHKLRIVQALQRRGEFVAMTGDGVNDAPALKQADIGIAMGITGTDVSKEASDMVLLDDNFATIVAATEEGRVVYTNIRRFIKYILGSNIGEVLTVAAAPLLGLPDVPLTPLQILWMNLVTDGLPALALAVEPPEPDVMRRPPFSPRESIFARGLGSYMVRIGLVFAFLSIWLMHLAYHNPDLATENHWKSIVFTTLCLAQMGHALAVRSDTRLVVELNPFTNPFLLSAVVVTSLLQLALLYVPPLRAFFGTTPLTLSELGACLGFSILMLIWIEVEKLVIRWYAGRQAKAGSLT